MEEAMDVPQLVASLITEDKDEVVSFRAAVAVAQYHDRWLLGLATNGDDRRHKWVCPGGRVDKNEHIERAAERECFEETGIRCQSTGRIFTMPDKPGVAFVHCKISRQPHPKDFKPNDEFACVGLFDRKDMKGLKLFHNVKDLIKMAKE
jgi:8-oxo-dGTP pyrophosphatase MutT (NUDIX family)